jgi:hypothetical protein
MTDPKRPSSGFNPVVVVALIVAAVFAMAGMAVLTAWAPQLSNGDDGRSHALSRSGVGYAGVVRLLRSSGRTVVLSRGGARGGGPDALLILTPPEGRDEKALNALRRRRGPILIVLPKWRTAPHATHKGWVREAGLMSPAEALSVLPSDLRRGLTLSTAQGARRPRLTADGQRSLGVGGLTRGLRTLSGAPWKPLVVDERGQAVLLADKDYGVFLLADPDLLNTRGLDDPAKARAALALIEETAVGTDGILFDLTLNGFSRPRSVLRLLLEPPLLGFTLCLFAAVLLIGWQAMVRFAPHGHGERAVAPGKRALADNTAALARLARREHRMAPPYADLIRTAAARAVAAPPGLTLDALTALLNRLAARGGDGGETFETLKARAEAARSPADLMAVARALNEWKAEMTRGRS